MPSSKRHVGTYEFTTFAVPEGDHWRWQVNRADMGPKTLNHVGNKATKDATGRAPTEDAAYKAAEIWLDEYLKVHPNGE